MERLHTTSNAEEEIATGYKELSVNGDCALALSPQLVTTEYLNYEYENDFLIEIKIPLKCILDCFSGRVGKSSC